MYNVNSFSAAYTDRLKPKTKETNLNKYDHMYMCVGANEQPLLSLKFHIANLYLLQQK